MDRAGRGVIAASVGATLGAGAGGWIGGAVVVEFNLIPCYPGEGCSKGLAAALAVVKGMIVGGYVGALLGMALLLRLRHHRHVVATVGVFSLTLLLGIAAWYGLVYALSSGLEAFVFFFFPLTLPIGAAITRWAVVQVASGAKFSRSP